MENQNEATSVVLSREESAKKYGSWFEEWIKNCKELKVENQKKLLKDIPADILQAVLASSANSTTK